MYNDEQVRKNNLKKLIDETKTTEKRYSSLNDSRNNSKDKEKIKERQQPLIVVMSMPAIATPISNTNIILGNSNTKNSYKSKLNSLLVHNKSANLGINFNTNTIINPKNTKIPANNEKFNLNNNSLLHEAPKNRKLFQKNLDYSTKHKILRESKFSNSMKRLPAKIYKFRPVSYSPKNCADFYENLKLTADKDLEKLGGINSNMITYTDSNAITLTNSPQIEVINSKIIKSAEFKKLPKLNQNTSPSSRDKYLNTDTTDCSFKKDNFIYNIFFTKLNELIILNDKNNSFTKKNNISIPTLSEYLLNIFDSIASNYDIKFKKIFEIVKIIKDRETKKINEINNFKFELDNFRNELSIKDSQIKSLILENEKNSKEKDSIENVFNALKKKYKSSKQNFYYLSEENKSYKNLVNDCKSEIEFLRKKDLKVMKAMYFLEKNEISLEEIIKENSDINDSISHNSQLRDSQNQSMITVYFPDKIIKKNNEFKSNKYKVNVPSLDFSNVPLYKSNSSCEKESTKGIKQKLNEQNIIVADKFKIKNFNKTNKYNKNRLSQLNLSAIVKFGNTNLNNLKFKKSKNNKSQLIEKYIGIDD